MVFARKLPLVYLDFCLGCAKAQTKNLEQVGHASSDHGAEGRIIEPSCWVVMGLCGVGLLQCLGAWRCPWLFFLVICGCLVVAVGSVSIRWGSIGCMACLPRWQSLSVCWSFRNRCDRMQKLVYKLAPIFLIQCFMYPAATGAMPVNLDSWDVLKKEA